MTFKKNRRRLYMLMMITVILASGWLMLKPQPAYAVDTDGGLAKGLAKVPQGLPLSKYFTIGTNSAKQVKVMAPTGGSAVNTEVVKLTDGGDQSASIWSNDDFDFNLNADQTASMWLYFGTKGGTTATANSAGDGMAFVLQNGSTSVTPDYGTVSAGETLGVWGVDTAGTNNLPATVSGKAIPNSWALEFDTYLNNTTTFDGTGQASSFDADTSGGTLANPHIASNYPGDAGSYTMQKKSNGAIFFPKTRYYATLNHKGVLQGSDFRYLADGNWHHLTIHYNHTTKAMTYTFNDKNPDTGVSQTGQSATVTLDPTKFKSSTGKLRWGFTSSTGYYWEPNLVAFEKIPDLVNADATVTMTDVTKNKPINAVDTINGNDHVKLAYQLDYKSGSTDWEDIVADLDLPTGLTYQSAKIDYTTGASETVDLSGLSGQELSHKLGHALNEGNHQAVLTLTGTANNETTSVDNATSQFRGTQAVVQATTNNFEIKQADLKLTPTSNSQGVSSGQDAKVTGIISAANKTLVNNELTVHATLNGTALADTKLTGNGSDGAFTITVPAAKLNNGANTLTLSASDADGVTSNEATVILTVGSLRFTQVSGDAVFSGELTGQTMAYQRNGNLDIQISDTRRKGAEWQLLVSTTPLTDQTGKDLAGNLIYVSDNQTLTLSSAGQAVLTHVNTGSNIKTDVTSDWTANQGLLLQTRSDATPGQYTGEVTWTLQNTVE